MRSPAYHWVWGPSMKTQPGLRCVDFRHQWPVGCRDKGSNPPARGTTSPVACTGKIARGLEAMSGQILAISHGWPPAATRSTPPLAVAPAPARIGVVYLPRVGIRPARAPGRRGPAEGWPSMGPPPARYRGAPVLRSQMLVDQPLRQPGRVRANHSAARFLR